MSEITPIDVENIKTDKELLKWHVIVSLRELQMNAPDTYKIHNHEAMRSESIRLDLIESTLWRYGDDEYKVKSNRIKERLKDALARGNKDAHAEALCDWIKILNWLFQKAGIYPPIDEDLDMRTPEDKRNEAREMSKSYIRFLLKTGTNEDVQKLVNEAVEDRRKKITPAPISNIVDKSYLSTLEGGLVELV